MNETFATWMHFLADPTFGGINTNFNTAIMRYRKSLLKLYHGFLISEARFNLFIEDESLKESLYKLKCQVLQELIKAPNEYLKNVMILNNRLEYNQKKPDEEKNYNELMAIISEQETLSEKYQKQLFKLYPPVLQLYIQFQGKCRIHLYKLINEQ